MYKIIIEKLKKNMVLTLCISAIAVVLVVVFILLSSGKQQDDTQIAKANNNLKPRQLENPQNLPTNEDAEKLYKMALRQESSQRSPKEKYRIITQCCQEILKKYPNTFQAQKAKELLDRYAIERKGNLLPKTPKARPLRSRF